MPRAWDHGASPNPAGQGTPFPSPNAKNHASKSFEVEAWKVRKQLPASYQAAKIGNMQRPVYYSLRFHRSIYINNL